MQKKTFTPDSLAQTLTDLRFELNPDPPAEIFPAQFFDFQVANIDPAGGSTERSPKYCATALAVSALYDIFGPGNDTGYVVQEIVLRNAINPAYIKALEGGFADTAPVPYFVWNYKQSGPDAGKPNALTNVGLLCDYFNHGISGANSMVNALAQIKGDIEAYGVV